MPSFVATLAGLLAVLGLQLYILGSTGSINLPYGSPLVKFGQMLVMPRLAVLRAGRAARHRRCSSPAIARARRRRRRDLSSPSIGGLLLQALALTVAARADRLLSQPGARRAVDVRPVRRPGRGDELCADPNQVGPLDDRRRRQPRGGAPRRHQRPADLHQRLRAVLDARGRRRRAVGGPAGHRPASRPAPATST